MLKVFFEKVFILALLFVLWENNLIIQSGNGSFSIEKYYQFKSDNPELIKTVFEHFDRILQRKNFDDLYDHIYYVTDEMYISHCITSYKNDKYFPRSTDLPPPMEIYLHYIS